MACFPVPLLAWLPRCLQAVNSPLEKGGWDYGGNQKAPPDMVAEDTVSPTRLLFTKSVLKEILTLGKSKATLVRIFPGGY